MTDAPTGAPPGSATDAGAGAGTGSIPAGETGLDLTPRSAPGPSGQRPRRPARNAVILGVIGIALVFLLYQALTEARVYFYNVDEAIERRDELADGTFQMQGTVVEQADVDSSGALVFTLAFDESRAEVRHVGDEPSSLFGVGEAVVVEGHWEGGTFVSSQILVKHSEAYVEDNPDRVDYDVDDPYATEDGASGAASTGGDQG